MLAALRFDGIEPPVIRDRIRDETDTQWIMLAAATSQLSPADLTALVVANTIHVDSGTLEIPPPGDRRWVHEPRADRPLPSRTAVAAAIAEMTPPPTDHQAK